MDGDWKNDSTFATCSTDKSVLVCSVSNPQAPLKQFMHSAEVNAVRWDPTGTLLASAADDGSVRVTPLCPMPLRWFELL
jgi:transducin (beta)-like 1